MLAVTGIALLVASGCSERLVAYEDTRLLMDTVVQIMVYFPEGASGEARAKKALEAGFGAMARVDALMNAYLPGSDVYRINAEAGSGNWVTVSPETLKVVQRALWFAELSGGAFDPTVLPLVRVWGFGTKPHVPTSVELEHARSLVNWKDVELDPATSAVRLKRPGMGLDLGAIAKGFAVDLAARALRDAGAKVGIINAGGNVYVLGRRPDGGKWRVGIRNPRDPGTHVAVLELEDQAAVTSGDYERFFIEDGKRYHHILDPKTGFPAQGARSVTVVLPCKGAWTTDNPSMDADALSTMLFVLGPAKAVEFANAHGVGVVLVDERGEVVRSNWVP